MAAAICRSPPFVLKSVPSLQTKPLSKVFTLKPATISLNITSKLQITSSMNNDLVFEDRSNGVICYRDDDGKIICEGYEDEEPRIQQEIEKLPFEKFWQSFGSDGELKIDRLFLQQSLECLETVNDGSGRGDFPIRANGFTS